MHKMVKAKLLVKLCLLLVASIAFSSLLTGVDNVSGENVVGRQRGFPVRQRANRKLNNTHQDLSRRGNLSLAQENRIVLSKEENLSPVILIPGDGGSRLQAKLDRHEVPHYYCEKKSGDWFDLWLNLSLLVPFALECWMDK